MTVLIRPIILIFAVSTLIVLVFLKEPSEEEDVGALKVVTEETDAACPE
jgi:hypothetical protein